MKKEEIIEENKRRLKKISAVYNPITGEGSTSVPRCEVTISGFPIENMYLPTSMVAEEFVQQLQEHGAEGYLREVQNTVPSNREIIKLWLRFCLLRIRHDFEYWARTMTTIADKGKGRDTAFTLNRPQRTYLKAMEELRTGGKPIDIILLKARQWGGSTLTQLYMLWIQLVHKKNWNSVICGDIEKQSSIVAGMLAKVISRYPQWASGGKQLTTAPYQGLYSCCYVYSIHPSSAAI